MTRQFNAATLSDLTAAALATAHVPIIKQHYTPDGRICTATFDGDICTNIFVSSLPAELTWDDIRATYYDDSEMSWEHALQLTEATYGTHHRQFGDIPGCTPMPHSPTYLEELGIPEDTYPGEGVALFSAAMELYEHSKIEWQELMNLIPLRPSGKTRIAALCRLHNVSVSG